MTGPGQLLELSQMGDGFGFQRTFGSSRQPAADAGLEVPVHRRIRIRFGE